MRLLVFGGWGQLGSELVAVAGDHHHLARPTHAEVDVEDAAAVIRVVEESTPDVVIDAAAFHRVEACEVEPDRAFGVNAVGALNVARAAREAGARAVFVSTDYVFRGDRPNGYSEDDPVGPVNVYGCSKAAGELVVRLACPDSLVVRGAGLFGHAGSSGKGGNFVETILARARAGERLSVADDIVTSPTAARDMAERLLAILELHAPPGAYHLANGEGCSWFEFARAIVGGAGLPVTVEARSAAADPVRRPACSVLRDTKTAGLGLAPARPWREALAWYLEQRHEPVRAAGGAG